MDTKTLETEKKKGQSSSVSSEDGSLVELVPFFNCNSHHTQIGEFDSLSV